MNRYLRLGGFPFRKLVFLLTPLLFVSCSFSGTDRFTDKNGVVTVHATVWNHSADRVELKEIKTDYRRADLLSTISGLSVETYSATGRGNDLNVSLNSNEGNQSRKMFVMTEAIPLVLDGKANVAGYLWKVTDTERELKLHWVTYLDRSRYSDEDLMKLSEPNDNVRYIVDAWISKK